MAYLVSDVMRVNPADLRVLCETALGKQEGYNDVFVLLMSHTSMAEADRYSNSKDYLDGVSPDDIQQLGLLIPLSSAQTLCRELILGAAATTSEAAGFDAFSASVRHTLIKAARMVHARELDEMGVTDGS